MLDEITYQMLSEMEEVFKQFEIEYYLVGAFARDVQFQSKNSNTDLRKTNDIDLAVCINDEESYYKVMESLIATGKFKRDTKEVIKLYYHLGREVDLIPFGKIENSEREVHLTKPKAFTLQMPGFTETFPFIEHIESGNKILNICPVEGLIMLKLISWHDRPQRTKDLTDIDSIIDAYFDWNSDDIYAKYNDVFPLYDTNDLLYYTTSISAHIIGIKIKTMLSNSEELYERILKILSKRENPRWLAIINGLKNE